MEPATADPSLLTDTATSDTTGSVGTVAAVDALVSPAVTGAVGSVDLIVVETMVSAVSVVVDSVELDIVIHSSFTKFVINLAYQSH